MTFEFALPTHLTVPDWRLADYLSAKATDAVNRALGEDFIGFWVNPDGELWGERGYESEKITSVPEGCKVSLDSLTRLILATGQVTTFLKLNGVPA